MTRSTKLFRQSDPNAGELLPWGGETACPSNRLLDMVQVAKLPLCSFVAFSSLFGYLLASRSMGLDGLLLFFAILMLACGAASLNSYQEVRQDRLVRRTSQRPLARGALAPVVALRQAQVLLAVALLVLFAGFPGVYPVWVGVVAVVIYNCVYTPLKYKTIWAVIPGAVCGALPPYIGWLAAGGAGGAPLALNTVALLAVWQIPHYWLVVLEYSDEYRHSIQPSIVKVLTSRMVRLVSVVWVLALVSIVHTEILLSILSRPWLAFAVSFISLSMFAYFAILMTFTRVPSYRRLFLVFNGFMLLIMVLFCAGSLIGPGSPMQ